MHRVAVLVLSLVIGISGLGFALGFAARAGATGATVTITSSGCSGGAFFCYSPSSVSVANGATVTWSNMTGVEHTVTRCSVSACGVSPGTGTDTSFTTMNVASANGSTVMHTFHGPGTYVYYCMIHGYAVMHGTVQVTGPPSAPTMVSATPGNATATVHWVPSTANGSPISGYVITPYVSGVAQASHAFASTATTETVTGLSNGTTFTFRVAATNGFGTGPQSAPSAPVTVGAPTTPTGVGASPGNATATVHWTAPASNNGSPVSGYVVTPYLSGIAQTARSFASTATTETVTGLTNAKTYTFKVAAKNANGTGPQSLPSGPVTVGAPTAPTTVSATPGNTTALVRWAAPASNNGSPISGYVVTPYLSGIAQTARSFASTATTQTVTGLTNAKPYTFKVDAKNANGSSPQSAPSAPITIGAPTAPTNVTATAASGSATVHWTAPSTNNGSAITRYIITPYIGAVAQTPRTFNTTATTQTVTGLTSGTTYTFKVAAQNANGTGPASTPSNSVTPT
jgi:plastocyanin